MRIQSLDGGGIPSPSYSYNFIIFFALFAFAFAVRAVFAVQWQATPYGDAPLLDAKAYDDWAQAIAGGHLFRDRAFYQSPLYPYFLAVIYKVFGHSYLAASFLNAALDAGTVSVLSLISFSCYGRKAAIITGILATLYAPMVFYTAPVMKEPLALLLLSLFLLTSLRALEDGKKRDYALSGFFLGLATLTRGNVLLLAPVLPAAVFIMRKRAALAPAVLFCIAFCAAIAPATVHNFIVSHDFVPVTYSGGFNLYIGHSDYANGTNAYPPEVSTDPIQEELNTAWIAAHAAGHALKPSDVSGYWQKKAVDFALSHLVREAWLLGPRFLAFVNGADSIDNYDPVFIRKNFPTILNLPLAGFTLVLTLAAFTLVAGWKFYPRMGFFAACIGVYTLSVVMFYVTDRYRMPVIVFLLPLAGGAAPCTAHLWKAQKKARLVGAGVAAALVCALASISPVNAVDFTAFDWGTLVAVYADKGDAMNAFAAFKKGAAISPMGISVQAYVRAAEMYERLGQTRASAKLIEEMATYYPDDAIAQYNLGRMQAMRGDLPAALWSFKAAQKLSPTYALTYYALAKVYERMNDVAAARKAIEDGLAINPEDERLREMKGDKK